MTESAGAGRFAGKVAVVTGGFSGIGQAVGPYLVAHQADGG